LEQHQPTKKNDVFFNAHVKNNAAQEFANIF
jgi:hypothetical protein